MAEYTEAQAQADVDALVARLKADASVREALLLDPRGVLVAAGLPNETIDEVDDALAGVEVEGFSFELGGTPALAVGFQGQHGLQGTTVGSPSTIVADHVSTWMPAGSISGHPSPAG